MSKRLFHDPQHWHDRAEGARKLAAEILDPVSRRMMLDIAESYESLARRAAQRLRTLKIQNEALPRNWAVDPWVKFPRRCPAKVGQAIETPGAGDLDTAPPEWRCHHRGSIDLSRTLASRGSRDWQGCGLFRRE